MSTGWWIFTVVLVAAVVGTLAWGTTELVLFSRWLRRTSQARVEYQRRVLLRRWLRFHGGLK